MNPNIWWTADALPGNSTLNQVLYDLRQGEGGGLVLDSVALADIIEDSDGGLVLDALITPLAQLQRKMDILKGVMDRAGGVVKVASFQASEPFTQKGVANVAVIFELSDGQTVSVYLHNPDTTPKKIASADELISWKWLLNKKDITLVVAPEKGQDLNVREVARRIMRLAEKNSPAFIKANAKRAEKMQEIEGLRTEIPLKEGVLADKRREFEVLQVEYEDWQSKAKNPDKANLGQDTRQDAEAALRKTWESQGVSKEMQDELLAGIAAKAQPGARVGPFTVGGDSGVDIASQLSSFLKNGDLNSALKLLDPIEFVVAQDALLRAGFSLTRSKNKKELMASVAADLVKAAQKGADGFGLRNEGQQIPEGRENKVKTAKGTKVATGFAVREADKLIASHDNHKSEITAALNKGKEPEPVNLTGKELGDFPDTEAGKKALRAAARDFMLGLRGKMIDCQVLGRKVEIRKRSIKETMAFSADTRKLKAIPAIEQLVASAVSFTKEENFKKNKKPEVLAYYRLKNSAVIDGNPLSLTILVEEDKDGTLHYDMLIDKAETKAALDSTSAASASALPPNHNSGNADEESIANGLSFLDHEDAVLDAAGGRGRMVFNLFIEGEEPEVAAELETGREGELSGDKSVNPDEDPQKAADYALFQAVIDGDVSAVAPGLDEGLLDERLDPLLEDAYNRNAGDPEMSALFEQAVMALQEKRLAAFDSIGKPGMEGQLADELGDEWLGDGGWQDEEAAALDGVVLDGANDQHWITTKTGSHLLIQGNPKKGFIVRGGAGGKFNGQKWLPKKIGKPVKAKEYHEMTREEFGQAHKNVPVRREHDGQSRKDALDAQHKKHVFAAMAEGKAIPGHVAKEVGAGA